MALNQALAAAFASALMSTAAPAASVLDAFTLTFGEGATSSNDPATGASGTATFSFLDEMGQVRLSIDVANRTDSTSIGAGATSGKLTGFAFDLLMGDASMGGFTNTGFLDTFLLGADFQPFGTLDVAFANNDNFNGGNANGALPEGQSTTVSFLLGTAGDAMLTATRYETAFFAGELQAGLRFQQVDAGEGSDKLVYNPPTTPMTPPAAVPLPAAGVLLLAGLGGLAAARRRV